MIDNNEAVSQLGEWMNKELSDNSHKGDWQDFLNVDAILTEITYHHQKVLNLLQGENVDLDKLRENIADTCNCYLFLANAKNLFKHSMKSLKELNENELVALSHIHNALYFDDSSDYRSALYEAMATLLGTEWNDKLSDFPSESNFERIRKELENRNNFER